MSAPYLLGRCDNLAHMSQMFAGARARTYLTLLSWLGDGRLRHCDVARDRKGAVVAITFARDIGYIDSVRRIEARETSDPPADESIVRKLRTKVVMLTVALGLVSVAMVLDEIVERALR